MMNRREFVRRAVAGAAGVGFVGAGLRLPQPAVAAGIAAPPPLNPAGCLWGVHADPRGTQTKESAIASMETKIGRKFAVDRQYAVWNAPLPRTYSRWTSQQGRIPYVGWHAWRDSPTGPAVPWRAIAAGSYDTWIRTQARALRDWGRPIYMTFHHEPEDDSRCGTAAEFRAAYARVRNLFIAEGASNVRWVATLMASVFDGYNGGASTWMPPQYDIVCVDGYNRRLCQKGKMWKSFASIFGPARQYAIAHGKPLAIGEFASVEKFPLCGYPGDPTAKAAWITNAAATIKSWPEVVFACYSHVTTSEGYGYWIDSSTASLQAFKQAGAEAYFRI